MIPGESYIQKYASCNILIYWYILVLFFYVAGKYYNFVGCGFFDQFSIPLRDRFMAILQHCEG